MTARWVPALLLLLAGPAVAGSARDQLLRFVGDARTLTGQFEQRVVDGNGNQVERAEGSFAMAKPRQFRWDYRTPYEQRIIADGESVWVYDVDLEQASVRPQSFDEANSPIAVLLDLKQLDDEFEVSELPASDGLEWIELKPRQKAAEFRNARFGMARDRLQRLEIGDRFGRRTSLYFRDWQRDVALPANHFRLELPEGVDLIGRERDGATITPVSD